MYSTRDLDLLSDIELSITPTSLRQWLANENWALVDAREGVAERWERPDGLGENAIRSVMLPLAKDYVDYPRRFRSLLNDLQRAYDFRIDELIQEISSVNTDLFFVRLDQTTSDGTIPFKQASALLSSIQKMVRAAATTTANPEHSHSGRRPAAVNDFLNDDLRFGHTKRGSFIITVASRVDAQSGDDEVSENKVDSGSSENIKPFSRRVLETLASGLSATKRQLATDEEGRNCEDFESARTDGMSYELVQSLLEVSDVEGLRSVDLSFQWASSGPESEPVDDVKIVHSEIDQLVAVRDRLKRVNVPEEQTFTGRVTDLSRDDVGGGQEELSIILEAELNGGLKKIKIFLSPYEYDWAIFAHQRRLLFTVTGTPVRRGRWVLDGSVKVDTEYLQIAKEEERSGRRAPVTPLSTPVTRVDADDTPT